MKGLDPLLAPDTVAVIGASRNPLKVGGSVIANLRSGKFCGRIVPVNARAESVQGFAAVKSVLEIEGAVDLAVLAIPAEAVLPALRECAARGVKAAVVISAGFREAGGEGVKREAELREWLQGQPLRVLGPNCLGWIRPASQLNLTFAPGMPERGGIAFVSHSGALAVAILDWARDRRVGFSLFASLGNQADICESDVLEAMADDAETKVIACYLEGLADGRRFLSALRHAAAAKPVVLLKAGRSAEGARAVSSHTGALAGSDRAFDAAVHETGAVRVDTVEELFDVSRGLATQPLPCGRRLAVMTNGGGLGIVSADAARASGLEMATLPETVIRQLAEGLPENAAVGNPIDLIGDADARRYGHALHALGPAGADLLLVLLSPQATTDAASVARTVAAATRHWPIPVVAALVGGARVVPGVRTLEEAGIPCFQFPERAVKVLAGMAHISEHRHRQISREPCATVIDAAAAQAWRRTVAGATSRQLGLADLAPLLSAYGLSVAQIGRARSPEEAVTIAERIGFPVALKVLSPQISHKSDVGGVVLSLCDLAAVHRGARTILERIAAARPDATVDGILVQAMAPAGKELLLGGLRDPQFGPLVMVGWGGIYVEVLADTAARLAPVSPDEARTMLSELKLAPLLHGIRGEPPVDVSALAKAISSFSRLLVDVSELEEIEVNPLVAGPGGVLGVDARARLAT
jgi:acetate---CoA ligase (ADP-forming)